jgi:hypothetical protein
VDDYTDEPLPAQSHCKQDGWVFIGACPHCSPSCDCGMHCTGPYLVGLDDNKQAVYSPFMTVLTDGDEGPWT